MHLLALWGLIFHWTNQYRVHMQGPGHCHHSRPANCGPPCHDKQNVRHISDCTRSLVLAASAQADLLGLCWPAPANLLLLLLLLLFGSFCLRLKEALVLSNSCKGTVHSQANLLCLCHVGCCSCSNQLLPASIRREG